MRPRSAIAYSVSFLPSGLDSRINTTCVRALWYFIRVIHAVKKIPSPPDRSKVRQALAETIRKLRHATGLAQERLALECGIDRTYMSALERGRYNASVEVILRILPQLGVTFVQFAEEFEAALRRVRRHHRK